MKKTFFGGGTVEMFSPSRDYHVLRNSFHERYINVVLYSLNCLSVCQHIVYTFVHFILVNFLYYVKPSFCLLKKYYLIDRFEDGTSNFLAIVSLGTGLRELKVGNFKNSEKI